MKDYIKSLDYFGYPISLNVKQSKGAPHKTFYGGFASAIIKLTLAVILAFSLYDMFAHRNSKTYSNEKLRSRKEIDEKVKFN
jgi:hypothetical protein